MLDTHAGSEGWLDLSNDKNVILSATLPEQMSYEQPFDGVAHYHIQPGLLEVLGEYGTGAISGWCAKRGVDGAFGTSSSSTLVLGSPAARRRTIVGQGVSERPDVDYLFDLLQANGYLERIPDRG
ncbi:MAG: hypothetical protein H6556_23095 [Lewinellaceae bacterium]|nr:hypothetical protein [Lewinellaceae bacterium]